MTSKPELTYNTPDTHGRIPNNMTIGGLLMHTGNGKLYQITGFAWMGATDEWGYLHHEVRPDGKPTVTLVRPLSHVNGRRENGEPRYRKIAFLQGVEHKPGAGDNQ